MDRSIIFLLFFFSLTVSASGQLKGGLKGGLNISDVIITDGDDYFGESKLTARPTYHFGSYVGNNFSKHFGYQIEMLFSNKGYILKTDSSQTNVSLNYLNWPLLLVYNMSGRLDFQAGVELGLLITGEPVFQGFDMGIDIGVEYHISTKVLAGVRYSHGLPFRMEIDSFEYNGPEPRYQHSLIQFYVGFNLVSEQ